HTRVCSLAQNLELIAFQKNLSFRAGNLFPKCFQCINVEHRSHTRVCSLAQNLELIAFQKPLILDNKI
ncbi:MAG: hypothetical protein RSD42_05760, partial [Oscillospiraceae bacterium]